MGTNLQFQTRQVLRVQFFYVNITIYRHEPSQAPEGKVSGINYKLETWIGPPQTVVASDYASIKQLVVAAEREREIHV